MRPLNNMELSRGDTAILRLNDKTSCQLTQKYPHYYAEMDNLSATSGSLMLLAKKQHKLISTNSST